MKTSKTRCILLFLLFFSFSLKASAQTFTVLNFNSLVQQGGVLVVKINDQLQDKNLQLFAINKLYSFNKKGVVFVGIDTQQNPDRYPLYLVEMIDQEPIQYDFYYTFAEVLEKDFGPPRYVGPTSNPNATVSKQLEKEKAIKQKAYDSANKEEDLTSGMFIRPLSEITETENFGRMRLFGPRNRRTKEIKIERQVPHGGVDLRARTRLPVMAINSGKVLLARNFPLRGTEGNMLIIDHGSGILSLYLHLSKFKVKVGDMVTKGQVVATSGSTPRGTQPHLHLMVKVHGTNVDPLGFIDTINKLIIEEELQ